MNLSMAGELAAAYRSGSQRARVVTEFWGEHNLYCPNCPCANLDRLGNNTKASDFICPRCEFRYQLKGQQSRIGNSVNDGAYTSMMNAIRSDQTPSFYFMQYELATWTVKNLLLIPHFAFPPSAIIRRNPLAATARRAGWIGCNIALNRVPIDARIWLINESAIISEDEVRSQFRRVKPLKDISVDQRGWTLEVLNAVRSLNEMSFSNHDIYELAPHFEKLHPNNRHIRHKIRQQLQVLRDTGFLAHIGRGEWKLI